MTRDSEERRNGEDGLPAECEARPNGAEGNRPDSIAHKQLIERLTDQRRRVPFEPWARENMRKASQAILSLITRAETAEAQRDELREALRPFAMLPVGPEEDRGLVLYKNGGAFITVGQVLDARQALHNTTNHGESNG